MPYFSALSNKAGQLCVTAEYLGMITKAAFVGSTAVVMLHTEGIERLDLTVVTCDDQLHQHLHEPPPRAVDVTAYCSVSRLSAFVPCNATADIFAIVVSSEVACTMCFGKTIYVAAAKFCPTHARQPEEGACLALGSEQQLLQLCWVLQLVQRLP